MAFAVIANGFRGIVKTREELQAILAIYPYPKFVGVKNKQEGLDWLSTQASRFGGDEVYNYGNTCKTGHLIVDYFIVENRILGNIDASKLGNIFIETEDTDILVSCCGDKFKFIIQNIELNNAIILHHILAIHNIINFIGEYVDINIIVPDISVYLACTKYSGRDKRLLSLKDKLYNRLGEIAFTVRRESQL